MNIDHFKTKLDAELKVVVGELKELGWKNPDTKEWETTGGDIDQTATEDDELGDRQEEYEERREETEALQTKWSEIKTALEKIENGTYGKCEECGKPIEEDRLEANPAARTCKADM